MTPSSTHTTHSCPYCGKELYPRYASLGGHEVFMGYEPCTCEQSVEAANQEAAEREERKRIADKQRNHEIRLAKYHAAGIKPRFIDAYCAETDENFTYVRRGKSLYITGNVGVGKTHYASGVAKALLDANYSVVFTDMPRIIAAIQETFGTSGSSENLMARLVSCDVLVIDDLGKENPSDWVLMHLFRLINERYENNLPVIITTQFSRKELGKRLAKNGDKETALAIVSRLSEMCKTVAMEGNDRRMGAANAC